MGETSFRPVFIGGCWRSGTTLLGDLLGVHPSCLVTPESPFLLKTYIYCLQQGNNLNYCELYKEILSNYKYRHWSHDEKLDMKALANVEEYATFVEMLIRSYGTMINRGDADIWIDHTPMHVKYFAILSELFPAAKFVHIVRDGRAVAASMLDVDWGGRSMRSIANLWMNKVGFGLAAESYLGNRIMRVNYEELVAEPVRILTDLCDFIGISYQENMADGGGLVVPAYTQKFHKLVGSRPNPARATSWKSRLTQRQIEIFEGQACDYLTCLGYAPIYGLKSRPLSLTEKLVEYSIDKYAFVTEHIQRRIRIVRH